MATIKIDWEEFEDIRCSKDRVVSDRMVGRRRWYITHEIVFRKDEKLWATTYQEPATESQEHDDVDEYVCHEVRPVEKVVTVYERVEAPQA